MTEADTMNSTGAPPNPDAALIGLCEGLPALKAAFLADTRDDHETPFWQPYDSACAAISRIQPETMAGVIAKARAALADGMGHAGEPDTFTSAGEEWAWDVARSLVRLAPERAT